VLRKIGELVQAGAVVVGAKPGNTPSLSDDEVEFHALADKLWGSGSGEVITGKGKVYGGQKLADVLHALQVTADFDYTKPNADTHVLFVHRQLNDGDLYYVDNRNDRPETFEATFRVNGKEAELWHADTGKIEPVSYDIVSGRTVVPLQLEPWGTVFVVFLKSSTVSSRHLPEPSENAIATVEGPWNVSFQPYRGAPANITLDRLISWNESTDAGVKYFSGTASYTKRVQAPASWFIKGQRLEIDLGSVKNLAEVVVNGKSAGILWKPPFRTDVTHLLQCGVNRLDVRVTNLWLNRLIGDKQPKATPVAFTTFNPYSADSPLLASGLLGPVAIVRVAAGNVP
jgi:hypothetical protein